MAGLRDIRFAILSFCFLGALSACDPLRGLFEEPPRRLPVKPITVSGSAPEISRMTPTAPSGFPVLAGAESCLPRIQASDNDVMALDEGLDGPLFEIVSEEDLTGDDVAGRVLGLADAAYGGPGCKDRKLKFRATGGEGTYYEGVLSRDDYALYREGRISRAELARRFDLQKLETLASVKLKLARAREGGDDGYAAILVGQWLEKEPDDVNAKIVRANVELDKENFADAAALYEDVLLIRPNNFIAWFNLAFAKQKMGAFNEAVAVYRKLADDYDAFEDRVLLPDDVRLHLADALLGGGFLDEARIALSEFPDKTLGAWVVLDANLRRIRNDYVGARGALEAYLKTNADSEVARFNLVLACLDLRDQNGARKEYEALKRLNPELADELALLPIFSGGAAPKGGL